MDWNALTDTIEHRPWPLPNRPWAMTMSWVDLLFAHWPVEADAVASYLPDGLTLDTYDGQAWMSVVPFEMDNTLPRGLTWWPRPMRFAELNLRTYVTVDGAKPGVWFFSLDAASRLAVMGARRLFHLPYFDADMIIERVGEQVVYGSQRTHRGAPPARFAGTYRPAGPPSVAEPGRLEAWLSERYCLYAADQAGTIYRGDIHHHRWPLAPVELDITENTLASAYDFDLAGPPALAHFVDRLDVVGWTLEQV
jgi:uncharacterized protein YqjF (DUF2071 family)